MFVVIGRLLASALTLVYCGVGWAYEIKSTIYVQFFFCLAVIPAGSMDNWYSRVKDEIKKQQEDPVWMSEDKVVISFFLTFSPM